MNDYYRTRYGFDEGRSRIWRAIAGSLQKYIDPLRDSVLELGSGYCDFINNIRALKKYAIDLNPSSGDYASDGVVFHQSAATDLRMFPNGSMDVVFASNLFEHLSDAELDKAFAEIGRVTKDRAKLIIMQPNYRYCYREYFDDYTHKKVFSHVSLADFLKSHGFEPLKVYPKFLPLTLKSRLPKSYLLTRLYLCSPVKPLAKQMLIISEKRK